jgi:voltage-gated potassium channel
MIFQTIFRKIFNRFKELGGIQLLRRQAPRVFALTLIINLVFAAAYYWAEIGESPDLSFQDAVWWSIVTTTTVGYGDFFPKTLIGRFVIAYPLMLIGIGLIGYLVGLVANALIDFYTQKQRGLMAMDWNQHIIFCNYPGESKILRMLEEFEALDQWKSTRFLLVTDDLNELPPKLGEKGLGFVKGNPNQEDILLKANLLECRGVFILAKDQSMATSDESAFAVGAVIESISRERDLPIRTVVEIVSEANMGFMKRCNVDGMVTSDGFNSCLLVQEFLHSGVQEVFSQLLTNSVGSQFYIVPTLLHGFKVRDVQAEVLLHETDMQVIGIIQNGKQILNPSKNIIIQPEDRLIILAESVRDFEIVQSQVLENRQKQTKPND